VPVPVEQPIARSGPQQSVDVFLLAIPSISFEITCGFDGYDYKMDGEGHLGKLRDSEQEVRPRLACHSIFAPKKMGSLLSRIPARSCTMPGLFDCKTELETVSSDVAWKLVNTLFCQTISLISGAAVFMVLGVVGFVGTGSLWYLGGLAYTACIFIWRFWQTRLYARSRDSATPVAWAWRSIRSGWATAAGWGAWSAVVLFEPEKFIVIMVIGIHAGLAAGGAVRNCAVPAVAAGQIIVAGTPLFFVCIVSGNPYLDVYAGIVVLHIFAALALTKFLHRQTLRLLVQDEEKSELVERLEIAKLELETLVATDAMTGIANRRAFDLMSAAEWRRSIREEIPLSLLLLDVDLFKSFNDFYGHQAGDKCLQKVAATIASTLRRPGDLLARYGGEEFAIILPQTDLEGASKIGEQIVTAFADLAMPHDASSFGHVTVSIGAACMFPDREAMVEQLTARADAALYAAKRSGRNRVHLADIPINLDVAQLIHEHAEERSSSGEARLSA
jgi:diguanylate cyclase (GGDEF)-like protein